MQASAFSLLAIRDYLLVRESVTPDMHVDVQMLTKQGKRRSKSTLSTHDIKGFDAPLISVKREFNLQDSVLSNSTQAELVTEGLGLVQAVKDGCTMEQNYSIPTNGKTRVSQ